MLDKQALKNDETLERQYFALDISGQLTRLGDCGDYEAADEVANDLGLDTVWIVDYYTAMQWLDCIESISA
jgi:hypothetical protein